MFTLPLDILLIFTAISPVIGWVTPKYNRSKIGGVFSAIALSVSGIALYSLYKEVSVKGAIYVTGNSLIAGYLKVDMLSIFMVSIFLGLGLAATIYSMEYVENSSRSPIYYTLILSMISGMVGIVFSGDLFTLYVFWELMSISSYALVAFFREKCSHCIVRHAIYLNRLSGTPVRGNLQDRGTAQPPMREEHPVPELLLMQSDKSFN